MRKLKKEDKLFIQIFKEIRSYIIEKQLKAGDFLPTEQTLCAELGISRNSLREAIKSMELIGMLEAYPGRGTRLRAFNLDFLLQNVLFFHIGRNEAASIHELCSLRGTLEISYMRKAFTALQQEDILHLRACAEAMQGNRAESGLFRAACREFHLSLFRPLQNGVLLSLLEALFAADEGFSPEKQRPQPLESIDAHFAIVDALEKNDCSAFEAAMLAHFALCADPSGNGKEQ